MCDLKILANAGERETKSHRLQLKRVRYKRQSSEDYSDYFCKCVIVGLTRDIGQTSRRM